MCNLPDDLLCGEILLRLPPESLFRFRAVSKRWRAFIDNPSFARAHQLSTSSSTSHTLVIKDSNKQGPPSHDHLYTFDLDAVNLATTASQTISASSLYLNESSSRVLGHCFPVSGCNGLILLSKTTPLEIWNLSTHERLQLPWTDYFSQGSPLFFGLGYDHVSQDMKAVVLDTCRVRRRKTHVYSLRSDTWRMIGSCCLDDDDSNSSLYPREYHGVFVGGALHWLLQDKKILALDLGTEKHRHIPTLQTTLSRCVKIDVLGGCLAVSGFCDVSMDFQVWVMKDYGSDDDESWAKLLSINLMAFGALLRPVAYLKDKNQVFMKGEGSGLELFLFDLERNDMKRVCFNGLLGNLSAQIIPRNIFRLRDQCGGGIDIGTSRIIHLRPQTRRKLVKLTSFDSSNSSRN